MKTLKIYKASAGSGKTFRLAVEYIKLVVADPTSYRNILAVTFTNKATAEMKLRILSQLYGIGLGLKGSDDYLKEVKKADEIQRLGLSDEQLRLRARQALTAMVHDYGRFRIETIDAFFQSIMRELAHELRLTNNLRVDLHSDEVLQEAVQELIGSLNTDKALFKLVLQVMKELIEEGRNWNVTGDMTNFGKHIFDEVYLENHLLGHVATAQEVGAFKQTMRQLRLQTPEELKSVAQEFLALCYQLGLDKSCFNRGQGGIYGFFAKTAEGQLPALSESIRKYQQSAKEWPSAKHPEVEGLAESRFMAMLDRVIFLRLQLNTVDLSLRHLNPLMLINTIDAKVRELNRLENRFLLADTAYMLWQLIKGQDIPFLYEKAGVRFQHIMIDEFQDTSALQWKNFVPLLQNCMATASTCLLVGDVKQSIYRWRNSDWSILKNIEHDPLLGRHVDSKPMVDNHRSAGVVVQFNNNFFSEAAKRLQQLYYNNIKVGNQVITEAYEGVRQEERPENKGRGYVRVELLEKSEYNEGLQLQRLAANVQLLIEGGAKPEGMCILVRSNREIPLICQALGEAIPDLPIISDEAYRLDSSPVVRLMVNTLRLLAEPNNRFLLALLVNEYHSSVLKDRTYDDLNRIFLLSEEEMHALLPEAFLKAERELLMMPLYEAAERIYQLLELDRMVGQDAYLFTFFDLLASYLADRPSDLNQFLEYWDESMHKEAIPAGVADGLRIMTIHKSKGLEFDTVLVPFCHWPFSVGTALLWCKPDREPFVELDLLPIDASKTCRESFFGKDYALERLKTYVDNLNLLYVAFTRAKNRLVVLSTLQGGTSCENVSYVVSESLPKMERQEEDFGTVCTLGDMELTTPPKKKEEGKKEVNVLTVKPQECPTRFVTGPLQVTFRQSNQAKQLFHGEDSEEGTQHQRYLDEGVLFHQLLSMLKTVDDLPAAVRHMDFEGYFSNAQHREDVMRLVNKALRHTEASQWFNAQWQVINECNILYRDTDGIVKTRRPDRVVTDGHETLVIDYKTGRQDKDHENQVRFYVQKLQEMGYPNVSGRIWYIRRGDIVSVNP